MTDDQMNDTIKCLSIRQPWASLIVRGLKVVENRTWWTSYRGPLAIHASKTLEGPGDMPPEMWADVLDALRVPGEDDEVVEARIASLPRGVIIGVGTLVSCSRERLWTLFEVPGQWHWLISNPRPLDEPVPWRGQPGLFEVPWPPAEPEREQLHFEEIWDA